MDDIDAAELLLFNWSCVMCRGHMYAQRKSGGRVVYMHRQLFGASEVDHRNGDGLDNRRNNLRSSSHSQNVANAGKRPGASRFHGVCWDKSRGLWAPKIRVRYKRYNLGRFGSEVEAAKAYDAAARKYFGEFACVNFPKPGERGAR